jgi:glycosyltransferase involved in cell wall biosynthesis
LKNKLISIIIPCYKQAQYLEEALQSVLEQTYMDWECIIVNDGSPDHTNEIAQKWIAKDDRFKYVFQENGGLSSARNAGITIAEGEFILPLDADDRINTKYLKLALHEFKRDPTLKLVYCKAEKFGEESGIWNLPPFSIVEIARFNSIFCSAVFKRSEWQRVGGYDSTMIYGLEDWELWIAILKEGGNVKCIDYVGFYYRITAGSMARSINKEERFFSEKYVANKHVDFILKNYDFLRKQDKKIIEKLTSEKFIINLFTSKFFGFNVFKLNR